MDNNNDIARLMYRVFQVNPEGITVFEYLASRFYDSELYSKGDTTNTVYNVAQRDVIHFIINKMSQAQLPQGEENGRETS